MAQSHNGHLATTTHWLLSVISRMKKNEIINIEIPEGISKSDFEYDIRYLKRRILFNTKNKINLLSFINLKKQQLIQSSDRDDEMRTLVARLSKKLNAGRGKFIYRKEIGGYEDRDDSSKRVTFKKGTTARAIIDELNKKFGQITTNKEIAEDISNSTGKFYSPDSVRSSLNTTIKKKFNAAAEEIGFPYEIRHPEYEGKGQYNRSVNMGKNSGYGLYKIQR